MKEKNIKIRARGFIHRVGNVLELPEGRLQVRASLVNTEVKIEGGTYIADSTLLRLVFYGKLAEKFLEENYKGKKLLVEGYVCQEEVTGVDGRPQSLPMLNISYFEELEE